MENIQTRTYTALSNSNLDQLITKLPMCQQAAICFLITGDPYIIPFAVSSEEPITRDLIALFTDRTVLRIRDDTPYLSFCFEDFLAALPPIIRNQDHPHYVKRFIRMSQALIKRHINHSALPPAA